MTDITEQFRQIGSRYLTTGGVAANGLPFTRYLMWGAGGRGVLLREYFESLGAAAVCFLDNSPAKHGTSLDGLPVLSPESGLREHPGLPIFIASGHYQAIMRQLLEAGVTDCYAMPAASFHYNPLLMHKHGDDINAVFGWLADEESRAAYASIIKAYVEGDDGCLRVSAYPQYFHPEVPMRDGDVIIDGGAFDGDTCRGFSRSAEGCRIVCFEPAEKTFETLSARARTVGADVTCIGKGLWSCDDTLMFSTSDNSPGGNRLADYGTVKVEVTSIDSTVERLGLDRVDVIKMDVEGAELEALKGARETILRHKPRLLISIYHKPEDVWTIPHFIKSLHASYEFFVGHHSMDPHESVLYAR